MAHGFIYICTYLKMRNVKTKPIYIPSGTLGGKLTVFNLD